MRFRILGPLEVEEHGRALRVAGAKQRGLLALLLLHADEAVPRDRLIDELWGVSPPDTAATALQVHVSQLRKLLGRDVIVTQAPGYRIQLADGELDLRRFEETVARAQAATPAEASALLGEALALWRGVPFADLDAPFARAERARLEERRLAALEQRIDADLELGRNAQLVPELDRLVQEHPLRERLRGQLMLALYRCGRQAEALDVYRSGRRLLDDELGLEPGEELRRLERAILEQDEALAAAPGSARVPTGTVTFLFTDIEGSTRLERELGAEQYADALAEHRRLLREAFARHGGVEIDTQGDAFFVAFPTAPGALAAAADAQAVMTGAVHVRMGLHTGTPLASGDGYVGVDVHRAARIAAAAHGGQVVVSSSTASLVDAELRDLGEHRFKDLAAPERVYQLGEEDFPPLRSLQRTNLPVPATAFLGRGRELADVAELLARDDVRLLTLTGSGGSGKTRLALQAAASVADAFPDGVTWVPLYPLRDAALVSTAVAEALEIAEEPGRALHETVAARLAGRRALLLLDNAEHLLPDVAGDVARIRDCGGPTVLVTSRERLQLQGERVWPVPPLEQPDGVALFAERARALDPSFTTTPEVEELCARLDQLPLALELAAARTSLFSPAQLLDRLGERLDLLKGARDAEPRHLTLRATIAWSYDLLDPAEQRLFQRLSVFPAGCTYTAAAAVCEADPDLLQSLLDKSLVRRRETDVEPRYWMLATIREYAHELSERSGEAEAVRDRHADHCIALAERAYAERFERGLTWAGRLDEEHDNLRAALDDLRDRDPLRYLQLAGALGWYWLGRAHYQEGARRLEDALTANVEAGPLTARALTYCGPFDAWRGRVADSHGRLEEAIVLWQTLGDETQLLAARDELGWAMYAAGGQESRALELFQRNLELAQRLGHEPLISRSLAGVCQMFVVTAQFERAEPLALELQTSMRDSEDIVYMCAADHYLADCAMERRDYALAEQHRLSALQISLASGNVGQAAIEVHGLALTAAGLGRDDDALRLEGAVAAEYEELGTALAVLPFYADWLERDLGAARARLGDTRAAAAFAEGRAMTWDQAVELALVPSGVG